MITFKTNNCRCLCFSIVFAGCIGPDADRSQDDIQNTSTDNGLTVTVTNVVDGDTLDVMFANGSTERVRLLGVNTPETHVKNQPENFEGIDSSDYLLSGAIRPQTTHKNIYIMKRSD